MAKFQPGDVVVLNSGSPKLTVTKVSQNQNDTELSEVVWNDGNDLKKIVLPSHCFTKEEG